MQSTKTSIMPTNAEFLILAKSEEHVRTDKRALRQLGMSNVTFFSSGAEAITYLIGRQEYFKQKSKFCMVFCHEHLMDMDGITFSTLLQMHPLGSRIFLYAFLRAQQENANGILVSSNANEQKFRSMGFTDVISWPFATVAMEKAIQYAYGEHKKMQNQFLQTDSVANQEFQRTYTQKVKEFNQAMLRYGTQSPDEFSYEESYRIGCEKFKRKLYDSAIPYLKHATDPNSSCKGQAFFVLYALCREQLNPKQAQVYLAKAVDAYVFTKNWKHVDDCVKRYAHDFVKETNPILFLFSAMVQANDVSGLAKIISISTNYIYLESIAHFIVNLYADDEIHPMIFPILSANEPELLADVQKLVQKRLELRMKEEASIRLELGNETVKETLLQGNTPKPLSSRADILFKGADKNFTEKRINLGSFAKLGSPDGMGGMDTTGDYQIPLLPIGEKKQGKLVQPINIVGDIESDGVHDSLEKMSYLVNNSPRSFFGDIVNIVKHTTKMYKKTK